MQPLRIALPALAALLASVSLCAGDLEQGADALEQARAKRLEGNLRAAGEVLESFLRDQAALPVASSNALHRELGEIRLLQGLGEAAASQFEKALQAQSGQAAVHYQAGIAYRMAGRDSEAARHLDRAIQLGFRTTSALLHLSGSQFATGRFGEGLRNSRELLEAGLQSSKVLLQLGRQLFTYLFYDDALRAFEGAFSLEPGSHEARFFLALTNYLLNRDREVVRLLTPLAEEGATAESVSLLASALARQDRMPEAKALFQDLIESHPASPHAYLNLSLVLLEHSLTDEAEEHLDALRGLETADSPKVFYTIRRNSCSAIADRLGSEDQPRVRDPDRAGAYFEVARSLASRHHHGTAVEVLRLARRYEGNTPRTLQQLASSCLHLEPHSSAPVRMLKALLRLDPERGEAHYLLGRAHLRQGSARAAIDSLRAAVALQPTSSTFRTELGRAYVAIADESSAAAAIQAFTEASELGPGNAVARYELGKLLVQQGRLVEARQVLEEAIASEPEFHNAYYALGQLHIRAGQPDRAQPYLDLFREKKAAAEARASVRTGFASRN